MLALANTVRLLVNCPDTSGIVKDVCTFIAEVGGNLIDSQQHSTGLDAHFFMRQEIDMTNSSVRFEELEAKFKEQVADKYQMEFAFRAGKKRMAIMVSKYDHCLYDILLRHKYGELDVDIPVIISNHSDLAPVGEAFGIPYEHHPIDVAKDANPEERMAVKAEQEAKIITRLRELDVDFVVMARYMQILTPQIINEFPYKIINVHHGFLPAFKGARPYHQAYDKGVKIIGATAHYATEDLDMGPIIAQGVEPVSYKDDVEDYIAKGRDIEKLVFADAIKAHVEDKIILTNNRTTIFD